MVNGLAILVMMNNSVVDDVRSKGHILLRFLAFRFNSYWHLCALECSKDFCTLMDCYMPLNVTHHLPQPNYTLCVDIMF